MTVRVSAR